MTRRQSLSREGHGRGLGRSGKPCRRFGAASPTSGRRDPRGARRPRDGKDPSEDQLRDPDFWEGSYKSAPSQEYLDYWKVVDGARAALDPTYTASAHTPEAE